MVPTLPASAKVRGSTLNRLAAEVSRAKSPGLTAATLSSMYDMRPRQRFTASPWYLSGFIDSGTAKITVAPGMVNNFVPTIGGVSLAAVTPPALTVTGASGVVYLDATVDGAGAITALIIASASSIPAETSTQKRKLVGAWTASGGEFTSVTSILNANQTFRMCAGNAEWNA